MASTLDELIDAVDAAIVALLNRAPVQSYSIGSRNLQYMTLRELREFRSDLLAQRASAASTTSGISKTRNFAGFARPQ
jgi:hypothetical protein